ncbi:MAG: alginate export family protein [Deltaproteobacteria bacterium]|nr:alginate export family protein [Deltaproteobacteria bacterium]
MKKQLCKFSGWLSPIFLFCLIFSPLLCSQASAGISGDFNRALKEGTPSLTLRFSYEYSDVDDPAGHKPANALTLRTRLGYRTGEFFHTKAFVQFHDMANPIDQYRWPGGGDAKYDVVGDPDGTRVQQVYLDVNLPAATTLRMGRQEIKLDDVRLIGAIDWRQNGQSFNAVSLKSRAISDLTLYASFINRVQTIFLTDVKLDGLILLNAKYTGLADQNISTFCYLLDTRDKTPTARDSATYGLRVKGKINVLNYDFTYAHQGDYKDGEDHNGNMFNAFLGAKLELINFGAGYSYISGRSNNSRPFDTLFSTAHKFNGWADTFINTNGGTLDNGLQDIYVQAGTRVMGVTCKAVYHYFDTTEDFGGFDSAYGDEIDLLLVKKIGANLKVLAKYAYYNEKNNSGTLASNLAGGFDEQVFWTRVIYSF